MGYATLRSVLMTISFTDRELQHLRDLLEAATEMDLSKHDLTVHHEMAAQDLHRKVSRAADEARRERIARRQSSAH